MFEKNDAPVFCTQVQEEDPTDAIATVKDAIRRGTDVIGLQMETLAPPYRTEDAIRSIVAAAGAVPVYLTDYRRFDKWGSFSWAEKRKELLMGAACGASLIDIPGNMFSEDAFELTFEEDAVARQKELIAQIHEADRKVLISSHVLQFANREEVLKIALEQQSRGADVIKIVTACNTDEELIQTLETTRVLKATLQKPFILVSSGEKGKYQRLIGPHLGSCVWLCAPKYGKHDTIAQPLLETALQAKELF